MPAERYYYPESFEVDQTIPLKDQEFHHLINVMRTRLGEEIEVVNGKGELAIAVVESIERKSAVLRLKTVHKEPPDSKKIILAQGIPRLNRLEFIIEKCTELGMAEIWLFPAARSEKKEFSENQMERLHVLAVAAMKQCGRLYLPKITLFPALKKWSVPENTLLLFGDTNPEAPPFLTFWKSQTSIPQVAFFIGPESGFSEEEVISLSKLNASGVKLHPNILRTDTAAIASLSLLSHFTYYN